MCLCKGWSLKPGLSVYMLHRCHNVSIWNRLQMNIQVLALQLKKKKDSQLIQLSSLVCICVRAGETQGCPHAALPSWHLCVNGLELPGIQLVTSKPYGILGRVIQSFHCRASRIWSPSSSLYLVIVAFRIKSGHMLEMWILGWRSEESSPQPFPPSSCQGLKMFSSVWCPSWGWVNRHHFWPRPNI